MTLNDGIEELIVVFKFSDDCFFIAVYLDLPMQT